MSQCQNGVCRIRSIFNKRKSIFGISTSLTWWSWHWQHSTSKMFSYKLVLISSLVNISLGKWNVFRHNFNAVFQIFFVHSVSGSTVSCNGEFTVLTPGQEYTIQSQNYPDTYPANAQCSHHFVIPAGSELHLVCSEESFITCRTNFRGRYKRGDFIRITASDRSLSGRKYCK